MMTRWPSGEKRGCMSKAGPLVSRLAGDAAVEYARGSLLALIGVLSDMSSLYTDLAGAGSVAAAKLAVALGGSRRTGATPSNRAAGW